MRTIKFRGKRIDNGEWVYGSLYESQIGIFILFRKECVTEGSIDYTHKSLSTSVYKVIPATVGQFTGLVDKNGVEIWESDIVKSFDENLTVIYNSCYAAFELQYDYPNGDVEPIWDIEDKQNDLEVIGNIHDNPELLNK